MKQNNWEMPVFLLRRKPAWQRELVNPVILERNMVLSRRGILKNTLSLRFRRRRIPQSHKMNKLKEYRFIPLGNLIIELIRRCRYPAVSGTGMTRRTCHCGFDEGEYRNLRKELVRGCRYSCIRRKPAWQKSVSCELIWIWKSMSFRFCPKTKTGLSLWEISEQN